MCDVLTARLFAETASSVTTQTLPHEDHMHNQYHMHTVRSQSGPM